MQIAVDWTRPFSLKEDHELIYSDAILEDIEEGAGVYVFARKYGSTITPLYVGQALNLHGRIKQQLNNVKLMRQVQNWNKNGARVLLLGYVKRHGRQDIAKVLHIVERPLIKHGLAGGHPLVNIP